MHVMAIDDERRGEPIIGERQTDDAWLAMVERPMALNRCVTARTPESTASPSSRYDADEMPRRNRHSAGHEFAHGRKGTGKFRREGHETDTALRVTTVG